MSSLPISGTPCPNREHLPREMSASVRILPPAQRRMGPNSGSSPCSRPSTRCPGKHTGSAVFVTFRLPFILKVPLNSTKFHKGRSQTSHAGAESTPWPGSGSSPQQLSCQCTSTPPSQPQGQQGQAGSAHSHNAEAWGNQGVRALLNLRWFLTDFLKHKVLAKLPL